MSDAADTIKTTTAGRGAGRDEEDCRSSLSPAREVSSVSRSMEASRSEALRRKRPKRRKTTQRGFEGEGVRLFLAFKVGRDCRVGFGCVLCSDSHETLTSQSPPRSDRRGQCGRAVVCRGMGGQALRQFPGGQAGRWMDGGGVFGCAQQQRGVWTVRKNRDARTVPATLHFTFT